MRLKSIAALVAICGLAACNTTSTVVLTTERAMFAARSTHAVTCEAVVTAHAAGALTGSPFNQAKAACIKADNYLDAGDAVSALAQLAAADQLLPK